MTRETDTSTSSSDESDEEQRSYSNANRLGVWRGWPVHIAVSQEPADAQTPDDFGVNLFVTNEDGDNVDIARIDTAHHGCHFDRLYLPEGSAERRQDYSVQYEDPDEAYLHFIEDSRWEYYVKRYHENHGLPEETRVYK